MRYILLTIGVLWTMISFAQHKHETNASYTIEGRIIKKTNHTPLEYATISLFTLPDSNLTEGTTTDKSGKFELQATAGKYFLKIEFVSYQTRYISPVKLTKKQATKNLGDIELSPASQQLDEITVNEEKGQVQVNVDKKVFNVNKDIANTGGNVQNVLQNIPSVQVGIEGEISLRGNSNVRILINGKPSGLTGVSGPEALEQIPAEQIKRIEVITNPSAKYDAEGLAGIINIILKEEKNRGFNGVFSLTGGYPHDHTATANLNYKTGQWNIFGSYSTNYNQDPGLNTTRRTRTNDDSIRYFNQEGNFLHSHWSHTFQGGTEYKIDNNNSITFRGLYRYVPGGDQHTTDYLSFTPDSQLTDHYRRSTKVQELSGNTDLSLNYTHQFEREKQNFSADLQYSESFEEESERIREQSFNTNGTPQSDATLQDKFFNEEDEQSLLIQADYTHPFGEKTQLEMGYKSIIEEIKKDYTAQSYNPQTSSFERQQKFSDIFTYYEGVHAAYALFKDKLNPFSYQIGLRSEYSRVNTRLKEKGTHSLQRYLDFFPSLHTSYRLQQTHKFQLSYSRRINRPSLFSLNPIFSFSDNLNIWAGNPNLNPEYTHSLELVYLKYFQQGNISVTLYYRHTNDAIIRLTNIDSNNIAITRPYNLATEKSGGLEMTYSFEPFSWWKFNGSFNYYHNYVDGKNIQQDYTARYFSWSSRLNSQFNIQELLQANLMFNYRGAEETPQGQSRPRYFLDISLKKDFWDDRFTVSARVQDVFNSRKYQSDYYVEGTHIYSVYQPSLRTYYLKFTYHLNPNKSNSHKGSGSHHHGGR